MICSPSNCSGKLIATLGEDMTDFGSLLTFRDLDIEAPAPTLRQLGDQLETTLPATRWERDRKKEADMTAAISGADQAIVFIRKPDADLPGGSLSLVVTADEARVGNVVPLKLGQLTMAEYNAILEDFLTSGLQPLAAKLGLRLQTTAGIRPITDWLSEAAAEKLRRFSVAANQSTGSSHPSDYKRWLSFIIQAHRDGCALNAPLLRRWLQEVEHWPEDQAASLASEYDFGRDLLKQLSSSGD
jgi:hypothetical protein